MNISVAVVIPTHDRAELCLRAVESVIQQTRAPERVVVVDDGSTDGTAERVAETYPSVEIIRQDNQGVSAARNRGVAACSESWIAFLDSDDCWKPEKLERQLELLERCAEEGPTLIHCDEIWIRRGNQVLQRRKHQKKGGRIFLDSLALCAVSPSAVLLRRDVLLELGGFDESFAACEDYDLWLKWTARYSAQYVDEPLVIKYGGHDDQLSRRFEVMDRFRIRALSGLLTGEALHHLSATEISSARQVLQEKVGIVSAGTRRRGREQEAEELEQALAAVLEGAVL